jgi:hypothetical protein
MVAVEDLLASSAIHKMAAGCLPEREGADDLLLWWINLWLAWFIGNNKYVPALVGGRVWEKYDERCS